MTVTMGDVAKRAGVSIKSVSNYFNDYPHMSESTRQRIGDAVRELDYRMNVSARNLRSGRTGSIMLALAELDQAYLSEFAQAVIRIAEEYGLSVVVETTGGRREREIEVLEASRGRSVDGVIYEPLALGPEDIQKYHVGFPLVLMGERVLDGPVDHVTMANLAGSRAIVQHLIAQGRRNIVLIGVDAEDTARGPSLRRQGYVDELEAVGIPVRTELMVAATPWHRPAGAAAMQAVIDSGITFDAVFGANDALALGAMRTLLRLGYSVPGDVAVAGFDDTEDARFSTPSLTTISPGRVSIARRAVEALYARINDENYTPGEVFIADYGLVLGESTGARSIPGP
jgi:DNA-binding LacI/PurR family transcriptional regulator